MTLSTRRRWVLPGAARTVVLEHCLYEHRRRIELHAAVVMPEHVHLLFTPLLDAHSEAYSLSEIMSGIKGASAHGVNKLLGRRGPVWEEEFFDHVLRRSEKLDKKVIYIAENPVRAGLVKRPEDYLWLWMNP
ncbi:MAG: transposase, partial [Acidobacteria bacterium]|nr:transposase [Acidobacteriota bacterium]